MRSMVQRLRRWLLPAIVCVGTIGCGGNGTDTSSPSSPQAPTITAQPQDLGVTTGTAASFNVTATGDATLAYQWRRNGSAIAGATAAAYSLASAAKTDDGAEFSVVVTNSAGSATSRAAKLTVTDPAAAITTSPQSVSTTAGQTATFSVVATGTGTLSYQWLRDGADIAGATAASYTTAALTLADNGAKFSVRVTDANASSATSAEAVLTVTAVPASTVRLSAGTDYTLVRRTDGSVLMLGSNSGVSLAPATALAGTNARAVTGTVGIDVSAGDLYALAVSADGKLWGWGHSGGGRLGGNAFNENVTTPREVPGVDQVRSALAAMTYGLALRSDGSVWHWPGVVSVASSGVATITPRSIAGLTDVVRLSAGRSAGFYPLALRSDGTVWELSWTTQTAMGPTGPVTTHTGSVRQLTGLSQVGDVACSSLWHCLALKTDGSVVAWGRNAEGQLGNGALSTTPVDESAPVAVIGLTSKVVAIGTTAQASVVLTEDGKVWSWGGAVYHGHAVTTDLLAPTELTTLRSAVRLSCSDRHCTVLRNDGSLWSWGGNGTGELGDGTRIDRSTPVQATGLVL